MAPNRRELWCKYQRCLIGVPLVLVLFWMKLNIYTRRSEPGEKSTKLFTSHLSKTLDERQASEVPLVALKRYCAPSLTPARRVAAHSRCQQGVQFGRGQALYNLTEPSSRAPWVAILAAVSTRGIDTVIPEQLALFKVSDVLSVAVSWPYSEDTIHYCNSICFLPY